MKYTAFTFFVAFLLAMSGCGKDTSVVPNLNGPQINPGCIQKTICNSSATECVCRTWIEDKVCYSTCENK